MSIAPDPRELCYPAKPTSNGYARRRYAGTDYSFGKHNTCESFALFGKWRAELIETGAPPDVSRIKRELREEVDGEPSTHFWRIVPLAVGAALLLLAIGGIAGRAISSPKRLTAEEQEYLRGFREHTAKLARAMRRQHATVADKLAEIREGKIRGRIPETDGRDNGRVPARGLLVDRGEHHDGGAD